MATPSLRKPRPTVRLRLETREDRVMCGEAGLLSAAVVSGAGLLRPSEPEAPKVAVTEHVGGDTLVQQPPPAGADITVTAEARPATDSRPADVREPARPPILDPVIDVTGVGLADFDLGSPDRSVDTSGGAASFTSPASAGPPAAESAPPPAAARAGAAPLMVTATAAAATSAAVDADQAGRMGPFAPGGKPDPQRGGQLSKITTKNRNTATMSGGWNPALRGVLIMDDGSRWFAAETGADIQNNTAIVYYKLQPTGWKAMGSVMLPAGVQQNVASVTNGKVIYSYGVAGGTVIEAWFNTARPGKNRVTANAVTTGGRAIDAGPGANYVGAAWHNGTRIVWWSSVGRSGAGGLWKYAFNSGRGWNGPVTGGAGGYNAVGYVRARFDEAGRMRMVGEAYLGAFPSGRPYLVTATVKLGNAAGWVPIHPRYARSALDLWREEGAGTHFLYRVTPTRVGYVFGTKNSAPSTFFTAREARFLTDGSRLGLVLGYKHHVEVRLVPRGLAADRIDWTAVPPVVVELPEEFKGRGISAIWPADESRQPHATDKLEFAIAGGYPYRDHLIYYVTL